MGYPRPMENLNIDMNHLAEKASTMLMAYLPNLILALVVLLIGWWTIGKLVYGMKKALERRRVDPSLHSFLGSLTGILLKAILIISVASMVGVKTTSFIAVLGAAGLAVGLALQGSLGNFAGGVLILLFRPFKVGDTIEAQGFLGTVKEIQVICTVLNTPDNKRIILPNGPLAGGPITNFSAEATRRVDFVFGIGYGDDIPKAKSILRKIAEEDSRILKEPQAMVVVGALADSSVNFTCRFWVKAEDYWAVFFEVTEKVKMTFDQEGISIPFPQQDMHFHLSEEAKKVWSREKIAS